MLKICLVLLLLILITASNGENQQKPPNIIFILADDMVLNRLVVIDRFSILIIISLKGWNDVSFHGSPQIPTPNIDTLAFTGIRNFSICD